MSADLLRRAAETLRAAARAADCGPWEVGPTFGGRDNRVYVRNQCDLIDSIGTCVIACQVSNVPQWKANAAFIALMHPPVALALAGWLESEAQLYAPNTAAFAVARAVLREDGEPQ